MNKKKEKLMTDTKLLLGLVVILIPIFNLILHYYSSKAVKRHKELIEILKKIDDKLKSQEEKK
jgi:hypothetical protein